MALEYKQKHGVMQNRTQNEKMIEFPKVERLTKTRKAPKRGGGANCDTAGEITSEMILVIKTHTYEGLDSGNSTDSTFKSMNLRFILKTASASLVTNWMEG